MNIALLRQHCTLNLCSSISWVFPNNQDHRTHNQSVRDLAEAKEKANHEQGRGQLYQSFTKQSLHVAASNTETHNQWARDLAGAKEKANHEQDRGQLYQSFITQSLHVAVSTISVTLHNQSARDQANKLRNRQQLEHREKNA